MTYCEKTSDISLTVKVNSFNGSYIKVYQKKSNFHGHSLTYLILSDDIVFKVLLFREQRFGPFTIFSSVAVRLLLALRYFVIIYLL